MNIYQQEHFLEVFNRTDFLKSFLFLFIILLIGVVVYYIVRSYFSNLGLKQKTNTNFQYLHTSSNSIHIPTFLEDVDSLMTLLCPNLPLEYKKCSFQMIVCAIYSFKLNQVDDSLMQAFQLAFLWRPFCNIESSIGIVQRWIQLGYSNSSLFDLPSLPNLILAADIKYGDSIPIQTGIEPFDRFLDSMNKLEIINYNSPNYCTWVLQILRPSIQNRNLQNVDLGTPSILNVEPRGDQLLRYYFFLQSIKILALYPLNEGQIQSILTSYIPSNLQQCQQHPIIHV